MTVGREASAGGIQARDVEPALERMRSDPEEIQSSPFGSFSVQRATKREAPESQGVLVSSK